MRAGILYGIDTRAEVQIERFNKRLGDTNILARAGKELSAQAAGPKLAWIRDNQPDVWERLRRWYSAHDFVVARLTDEWVIDHHTASQYDPLYDVVTQTWATDWIEALFGELPLPRLVWPRETAGTHGSTVFVEVVDGSGEHRRLAGACWADDDHEWVVPRDRRSGFGLEFIEPTGSHGGRRLRVTGLTLDRPRDDVLFLGEGGIARVIGGDRFNPYGSSVGCTTMTGPVPLFSASAMPRAVVVEVELPDTLADLQLPTGLRDRLAVLLDRQDLEGVLADQSAAKPRESPTWSSCCLFSNCERTASIATSPSNGRAPGSIDNVGAGRQSLGPPRRIDPPLGLATMRA